MISKVELAALTAALVVAISTLVPAQVNSQEDGNSIASLANSMNEKFQQLFDRFAQLELKVDRILESKTEQTGCSSQCKVGRGMGGHPLTSNNNAAKEHSRSLQAHLNATLDRVHELETIISHREFHACVILQKLRVAKFKVSICLYSCGCSGLSKICSKRTSARDCYPSKCNRKPHLSITRALCQYMSVGPQG